MMTGQVLNLNPLIPVEFRRPDSPGFSIEFIVDTGFTDQITLPSETVKELRLPLLSLVPVDLADGSTVELRMHSATILWGGFEKEIRVFATGQRPLLGTALLDGFDLFVQFRESGLVSINALETK